MSHRPNPLARRLGLALAALGVTAECNEPPLTPQVVRFSIVPEPTPTQSARADPVGMDLGPVPMFGSDTATFRIFNESSLVLILEEPPSVTDLQQAQVEAQVVAAGQVVRSFPFEIAPRGADGDQVSLRVTFTPLGDDGVVGSGRVEIPTNAGEQRDVAAAVEVRGEALFIGTPNLELQYGGTIYQLAPAAEGGHCTMETLDGTEVCTLPPLPFGNVSLGASAQTSLILRNTPTAGTCRLPPRSDGSVDCRPACVVTFDRDPTHQDLGIGFLPADAGFGVVGSATVPFRLAPAEQGCPGEPGLVRGQVEVVLSFVSGDEIADHEALLVLESDDPDAPIVHVPLTASSREAPVAVAQLRTCSAEDPPPACTEADDIQPLERVYLQGRDSFDPNGHIVAYQWQLLDYPRGANPLMDSYQPVGTDTALFSLVVPVAGTYTLRLRVTNDEGVSSGISDTSDVTFRAVPDSRLYVALTWEHDSNDQDLHLVRVDEEGRDYVFKADADCFWHNCRPSCLADPDQCTPSHWFGGDPPYQGPNPRLDIDRTDGYGPENINIDAPAPGRYRVYVHYYGLTDGLDVETPVEVSIFIDGAEGRTFRETLRRNDLWAVAEIVWGVDDVGDVVAPDGSVETVRNLGAGIPRFDVGYEFSPSPF